MSLTNPKIWIAGTAALCAVIVLAGWFLLISPKNAEAADLRSQTESTIVTNEQHEVRLAQLKADFAQLPQHKAELAAIQKAMPAEAQLAALTRELTALEAGSSTTLMSITPGVLSPVAPDLAAPAAPAEGATDEGAAQPAPATTTVSQQTVSVEVVGSFEAVEAFVKGLQAEIDRRYLIDAIVVTAEEPAGPGEGKPAVTNGDVTIVVTGRVFVLEAPVAATGTTTSTTTAGTAGTSDN
jgi:Tfp pilus assembly protein PilO